ncbi:MFS-type transporter SLC18B1 [Procambarus clarkii]|uniref:MFS-type transporter SLC18B1 n=1 Tax=Procambarus clarkii TaxID=6728 RepID=UPI001E673FD2|nr:MFS-type transporter SLC18B1-like [Procambarus clarkii]
MSSTVARCLMDGRQSAGSAPLPVHGDDNTVTPAPQEVHCSSPNALAVPLTTESWPALQDVHGSSTDTVAMPSPLVCGSAPAKPDLCINTEGATGAVEGEVDAGGVHTPATEPQGRRRWPCWRKNLWGRSKSKDSRRDEEGGEDSCGVKTKGEDSSEGTSTVVWSFTRQQWLLLMVLCLGALTSSFAVCLFPPFFPHVAQQKGCSSTVFGLIIGTNCLTAFLVTPIIGKKLRTIGVKFAFSAGVFCSGGCCFLSGFLEWFAPGPVFVIMAILIRMTQATANAGISTATFAYIGLEFPDTVAKVFAWTRTTMNLAQMFGPVVGGALLQVGGFKLPFIVMGTVQMSMTLIALYCLPYYCEEEESEKCEEVKIWKVFAIKGIWISFITFIFSTMSNGFLSITLEPQVLRKYHLSPLYVGLLFGLKDGANSLASPFWGYMCDRYDRVKIFIFFSSCLAFVSFFLLGPFPGVPITRTLSVVIVALVLNGVGIGGQQVSGVVDAMREVVGSGFPDVAGTHGCVAGLWASLSGVGRFTSRTGSGFLVDMMGFRKASVIVVGLHGFLVVMTAGYLVCCRRGRSSRPCLPEARADTSPTAKRRREVILTTSPSEPFTTKTVNLNYREDIEDSIFCGSAPIPTSTRYARNNLMSTTQNLESV